jgi:hypothetical protein
VTSVRSTTSPPPLKCRREILTNRPLESSVCSAMPVALATVRASTVANGCASSGSPSNLKGGGIALLDFFARIEHQDAARQAPHQRRKSRGQVLFAGACLAQFGAELRDLSAQCVECFGKLLGSRTEGQEGCLQVGVRVAGPFEC